MVRVSYREARRIAVFVVGATLLLVGTLLLVLPGPGLPLLFLGLSLLATEFVWARRWLARLRTTVERAGKRASRWRFWRRGPTDPS